jgi:hypothetical protein
VLRYFRINDPYRLLFLLFLLVLTSLPLFIDLPNVTSQELKGMVLGEVVGDRIMYVEIIDHTAPLMAVAEGFFDFVFGRSLLGRHILALVIIFFQASYFGILLINNKAYNENTYVPALIFGILCFLSFDLLAITPELLASTLLLLALNNLFKEIEFRVDRDSIVLNMGVFLGLSSLFVFSYAIFLPGAVFILIAFARTNIRKILLLVFGFVLVHGVLFTLYYCYERTDALWANFYIASIDQVGTTLVGFTSLLVLLAVPAAFFVFSLFMLTREARFTKYQSQLFQTIFLWLAIALVQVWLKAERTPHSFYVCIPPIAYFISHYLLLIRRKAIAEAMLWVFVMGVLSISTISHYGLLKYVDYAKLFPASSPYERNVIHKKVMVVGDDIALYRHNTLSGYFLDGDLSRKYFDAPDFYENIVAIHQSLLMDPPDVIVDENDKMGPIIKRIPYLKDAYRKEDKLYWKR